MGKKQKGPNVRKKMGLDNFLRECDDDSSGSGKNTEGNMGNLEDTSSSLLEESAKNQKAAVAQKSPKSPYCSRTLGEYDTESDDPSEKNLPAKGKDNEENTSGSPDKKAPWVNLFKDNRKSDQRLSLKVFDNLPKLIYLSRDIVDDVEIAWGYYLVGYFAGRFPGKKALLNLCDSWKVNYKYFTHTSGWLVFKFENDSDRESVLNGGPYFVFRRPLLFKVMPECFEFDDEDISRMPVWVVLPGLSLDCWNSEALGMIASKIRRPISIDNLMYTKGRLSYARVLVEVDAAAELVRNVNILLATGKERDQKVVYEYEPKFCSCCKISGHSLSNCEALNKSFETSLKVPAPAEVSDGAQPPRPIIAPAEAFDQMDVKEISSQKQTEQSNTPLLSPSEANMGQPEVLEGDAPFILVENSKGRMGKQKGKTRDKSQQTLRSQAGTSSFAAMDRVLEKKFRLKNGSQKKGHASSSSDKLKGPSIPLSP